MRDLRQIRQFTLDYLELQGLRMLPLGFFFLFITVQQMKIVPWLGTQGDLGITLPVFIIVAAAWFLLGRYYENNFGTVEPLKSRGLFSLVNLAILLVMAAIIVLENTLYRQNLAPPFSLIGLGVGGTIFIAGLTSRRWYYVLGGIALLAASFLPLLAGGDLGDPLFGSIGIIYSGLLGVIFVVAGVLDHLRIVRAFSTAQEGLRS